MDNHPLSVAFVVAALALGACDGRSASTRTNGGPDSASGGQTGADAGSGGQTGADATTPQTLTGAVGGRAFVVRDVVIATTVNWGSAFAPGTSTVLLLSDAPNLCNQLTTNLTPRNSQLLIINLAEPTQAMARPIMGPGDFPIADDLTRARVASAHLAFVDPDCTFDDSSAVSGSVSIEVLDAGGVSGRGTLSLTLQGGTLAGNGGLSGPFSIGATCDSTAVDDYLNQVPSCP